MLEVPVACGNGRPELELDRRDRFDISSASEGILWDPWDAECWGTIPGADEYCLWSVAGGKLSLLLVPAPNSS